jgi:predicted  nucleic acid-binding Zn-ribbon protein
MPKYDKDHKEHAAMTDRSKAPALRSEITTLRNQAEHLLAEIEKLTHGKAEAVAQITGLRQRIAGMESAAHHAADEISGLHSELEAATDRQCFWCRRRARKAKEL